MNVRCFSASVHNVISLIDFHWALFLIKRDFEVFPGDQMKTFKGNNQSLQGYGVLIPHCPAIMAASIPVKYSCVWLRRQGASSFCPWPYTAMSPRDI